jgi:hypothetical protein
MTLKGLCQIIVGNRLCHKKAKGECGDCGLEVCHNCAQPCSTCEQLVCRNCEKDHSCRKASKAVA